MPYVITCSAPIIPGGVAVRHLWTEEHIVHIEGVAKVKYPRYPANKGRSRIKMKALTHWGNLPHITPLSALEYYITYLRGLCI